MKAADVTGLELAREYFEEYGGGVTEKCPETAPFLAFGIAGSGSECFGFDDGFSRDHDFGPGFCIFIPGEELVDSRTAFRLQRAYDALPAEYRGFKREALSPVGGKRRGVIRIADFFGAKCGSPDGTLTSERWLSVPEYALAEAVNGEIFRDSYGLITEIRQRLKYFPEEIRRKKLAGYLLLMAQAGQYNYGRCAARGETGAAQLAAGVFADAAMHVIFLLNARYMPYYKWSFRALRALPELSLAGLSLEYLISSPNDPASAAEKREIIEGICADIAAELEKRELTRLSGEAELEKQAYAVNDAIRDERLRNMHILTGVG